MSVWDELRETPKAQELSAEQTRINQLITHVFGVNEEGKELLDSLLKQFLEAPVCPVGRDSTYGYYREGQNSLLLSFKRIIAQPKSNK